MFCGVDWAEDHHDVALVDAGGKQLAKLRISDDAAGFAQLTALLVEHGDCADEPVPVAIETAGFSSPVSGPLAGRSPRSTRWRSHAIATVTLSLGRSPTPSMPRYWRTFCEPTWLLTDPCPRTPSSYRPSPCSPGPSRTPSGTEARPTTGSARSCGSSTRRSLRPSPSTSTACAHGRPAPSRPPPHAGQLARLTVRRLQALLKQAGRVRGIQAEADSIDEVFQRDYLHQPPQVEAALGRQTTALLRQLNTACQNADELEEATAQTFEEHPDAQVIRSFPGLGSLTGARVLTEIGADRTRFANAGALKAYAGSAPVTQASGKSCVVMSRKIKNQRLAAVGYVWAFVSLTKSPGARTHYDRRREVGDRHVAAQRNLFNRFMGMLFDCLQHGQLYDETKAFPIQPLGIPAGDPSAAHAYPCGDVLSPATASRVRWPTGPRTRNFLSTA
ncbi:hypothetical protein SANTM175S_05643 [Streptomyces antimycoticus]